MKRTAATAPLVAAALALTACGGGDSDTSNTLPKASAPAGSDPAELAAAANDAAATIEGGQALPDGLAGTLATRFETMLIDEIGYDHIVSELESVHLDKPFEITPWVMALDNCREAWTAAAAGVTQADAFDHIIRLEA